MSKKFDPTKFTGKKQRLERTHYPGISYIWEWHEKKGRYVRRTQGLRYSAYKKRSGIQKTKCFVSYDQARLWRESPFLFDLEESTAHLTFGELREKFFLWKEGRVKRTTAQTYKNNSRHLVFFDRMLVRDITPRVIDQWFVAVKLPSYLKTQHSTRLTYSHELEVLRQILSYYAEYIDDSFTVPVKKRHAEDSIIDKEKYLRVRDKRSMRYMSEDQIRKFLQLLRDRAVEK